jgi:hypothetical protein
MENESRTGKTFLINYMKIIIHVSRVEPSADGLRLAVITVWAPLPNMDLRRTADLPNDGTLI